MAAFASVDAYLAACEPAQRAALQSLRETIASAAPGARECIAYGIPSYRYRDRVFVSFAAAKRHCAFHAGARPVATHRDALAGYETGIGTVRFSPERPLPKSLVRELVRERMREFDGVATDG